VLAGGQFPEASERLHLNRGNPISP
jgi:hypothetical protein